MGRRGSITTDLLKVRIAALLHDIGKPYSWANQEKWSRHAVRTREIVSHMFGDDVADLAMHHHTGRGYESEYRPRNDLEWLIAVSDTIASGADRPEEDHASGGPVPSLPIKRSHLLSDGSEVVDKVDRVELGLFVEELKSEFESHHPSDQIFEKLLNRLAASVLTRIPADTRAPYNDTSLYHHLKLTAAIANCAHRSNQHGRDPEEYTLTLVSGDADQIGVYLSQSLRIPDLRGRSSRVMFGARAAAQIFSQTLGPECVLFEGGGGFLALAPATMAEEFADRAKKTFEKTTQGRCTMTTSCQEADGQRLKDNFGQVWEQAMYSLRNKKLSPKTHPTLTDADQTCDICQHEKAIHEGRPLPTTPPRNEQMCEHCHKLRAETPGTWVDTIRDQKGYLGILRMDGDNVGGLLSGRSLKVFKKSMAPSRLAALSSLIHDIIQVKATDTIRTHRGETVYSGGDDLLAILPGREVFRTALEIAKQYKDSMAEKADISCGIAFAKDKSPIYSALEASKDLLNRAKAASTGSVAFVIAPAEGVSSHRIEDQKIYSWNAFQKLLDLADSFQKASSAHQMRLIAEAVGRPSTRRLDRIEYGKAFVKYQMGRKRIPWPEGQRLLKEIDEGNLVEAFSVYNTFVRD